jgi:hypothetical protein
MYCMCCLHFTICSSTKNLLRLSNVYNYWGEIYVYSNKLYESVTIRKKRINKSCIIYFSKIIIYIWRPKQILSRAKSKACYSSPFDITYNTTVQSHYNHDRVRSYGTIKILRIYLQHRKYFTLSFSTIGCNLSERGDHLYARDQLNTHHIFKTDRATRTQVHYNHDRVRSYGHY